MKRPPGRARRFTRRQVKERGDGEAGKPARIRCVAGGHEGAEDAETFCLQASVNAWYMKQSRGCGKGRKAGTQSDVQKSHTSHTHTHTHTQTDKHTHLESVVLLPVRHVQDERRDDVEALAVPDLFVPARVGEQHSLQYGPVLVVILPAESGTPRPVQILQHRDERVRERKGVREGRMRVGRVRERGGRVRDEEPVRCTYV